MKTKMMTRQMMRYIMTGVLGVLSFLLFVSISATPVIAEDVAVDMAGVDVFHCPDGCDAPAREKNFSLQGEQSKATTIEYEVVNKSEHTHKIKINYVDGGITKDATQSKACKNEDIQEQFGQYVSGHEEVVTLSPDSSVTQRATIKLPMSSIGQQVGCLTYSLVEDTPPDAGEMFRILIRKARFIDINIPGDLNSATSFFLPELEDGQSNVSGSDEFAIYQNPDGTYTMKLGIKNEGDLIEVFALQGMMTDILGKEIALDTQAKKILPGQEGIVSYVLNIPWYKFGFDVDLDIKQKTDASTYKNDSDVINALKEKKMLDKKEYSFAGSFFVFPRRLVRAIAALIGLILLLIILRRMSKKRKQRQQVMYADQQVFAMQQE